MPGTGLKPQVPEHKRKKNVGFLMGKIQEKEQMKEHCLWHKGKTKVNLFGWLHQVSISEVQLMFVRERREKENHNESHHTQKNPL